jgi:hypothetical protein
VTTAPDPRVPFQYSTSEQYLQVLLDVEHPEAVERQISYAVDRYRDRHGALRQYLSGGGRPGGEARSPKWREAEAAVWASATMLALLIDTYYPGPDGTPPLGAVYKLIEHRVGPQCTGWTAKPGEHVMHHPDSECPIHSGKETHQWL